MVKTGLGALIKSLVRNRKGSITPVFAALMVPLSMLAGFSVDLARAHEGRAKLQDAVDAAALALAHQPAGTPLATLTTQAQTWINGNLHDTDLAQPINVTITNSNGQLILAAHTTEQAMVSGLVGLSTLTVAADSTVKWGLNHVEVALVLDNTGSMDKNNKIQTLASAAKTLVSTLMQQAGSDVNAVKISIVPFSMTVNAFGSQNVGASYTPPAGVTGIMPTDYGEDIFTTSNVNRFTLFNQLNKPWAGCVEARPYPYDTQDTAPNTGTPASMFVPFFAPDEPDTPSTGSGKFGNNYMSDGTLPKNPTWKQRQGNALKYTGSVKSGSTLGPNSGCSLQPLVRLTNNASTLNSTLGQMQAVGDTNLAIGLQWGWLTLSPNPPFGDGVAYNTPNTTKIIVFLTDGQNQNSDTSNSDDSTYSAEGYIWQKRLGLDVGSSQSDRTSAMDSRTAKICSNIKAQNIVIYTVRIDVATSQSPAVLQNCATSPGQFYDVPQVSNLPTAFNAIAGEIGKLRIAQ